MSQSLQWLVVAATVFLVVLAWFKLFKALNSPAGERYLRQRTQGPFVPVAEEASSILSEQPGKPVSQAGKGEP